MKEKRIIRRHALVSGLVLLSIEAGLLATGRHVREFHLLATLGLWGYYVLLVYAVRRRWLTLQLPVDDTGRPRRAKRGHSPPPPNFWLAMGTRGYLLFWLAVGVGVAWAGWLWRSQFTGTLQLGNSLAFLGGWIVISLLLFAAGRLAARRWNRKAAPARVNRGN